MNPAAKFSTSLMRFSALSFLIMFSILSCSNLFSQVSAPVLNPPSGKYQQVLSVTISCATPDAVIYFTTDGSEPTTASPTYRGQPILVANHSVGDSLTFACDNDPDPDDDYQPLTPQSMTIKAVAVKGAEQSPVTTGSYVLDLVDATFHIAYADPPPAGGSKHQLDIYHPHGETNNPVLFFIHGGAWKQGDKNMYMELGNTFAGYYHLTTVVANYQLSTDPWYAVHPTHIQDVAMAFNWVYRHIAEYGGDPENIFIFGQSAGGHLVSLLATDTTYLAAHGLGTEKIKGVISMSGAYDLYALVKYPLNPLGLSAAEVLEYKALCLTTFGSWQQEVLDAASPAKFIRPDQPPFYLISLIESGEFLDMPGFCKEADNFYADIQNMGNAVVEMKRLTQADIPPEIAAIDFPGDEEGHREEIYAINSRYWNSVSTRMVADFIKYYPAIPEPAYPSNGASDLALTPTVGWQKSPAASYYQLQLATGETFEDTTLVFDAFIADTLWTLAELAPQAEYFWRVRAISAAGESDWSTVQNFFTSAATSIRQTGTGTPRNFSLKLYPNPFNPTASIRLQLPFDGKVRIKIYDVLGREITTLLDGYLNAGVHQIPLDASRLAGGLYFCKIVAGNHVETEKFVVLK